MWKQSKSVKRLEPDSMPVVACRVDHSSALAIRALVARAKAALKEDPPLRTWTDKDTKKPVVDEEFGTGEALNSLILATLFVDDPSDEEKCAAVRPGQKIKGFTDDWSVKLEEFTVEADGRCSARLTYDAEHDGPWQEMLAGLMVDDLEFASSVCIFTTDKKLTPFQVKRVNSRIAGQNITLQFSSGTTRLVFKCDNITTVLQLHTMGENGAVWTTESELAQEDARRVETAVREASKRASVAHVFKRWEDSGRDIPAMDILQVKCEENGEPKVNSGGSLMMIRTRKAEDFERSMTFMDGVVHVISVAGSILAESPIRNQKITPAIEDRGFMTALAIILMARVEFDQAGENSGFVVALRKKMLVLMGVEEKELEKRKGQWEIKKKEIWDDNKTKGTADEEIKKIVSEEIGGEPEMDGAYELYRLVRAQLEQDEARELEAVRETKTLDTTDTKVSKPTLSPRKKD